MTYTPGPWSWSDNDDWKFLRSDAQRHKPRVLEAYVRADGDANLNVSPADMALIKAAPDLLGALRDLAEAYVERCSRSGYAPGPALAIARAAIAKAEGRS